MTGGRAADACAPPPVRPVVVAGVLEAARGEAAVLLLLLLMMMMMLLRFCLLETGCLTCQWSCSLPAAAAPGPAGGPSAIGSGVVVAAAAHLGLRRNLLRSGAAFACPKCCLVDGRDAGV
jgi:hypothetical protein